VRNDTLKNEMRGNIDPCGFRSVRAHYENPASEIEFAVWVDPETALEDVGEVAVRGEKSEWSELVGRGKIKFIVPELQYLAMGDRQSICMSMDNISNYAKCYVLYLPPMYLVHLTEDTWA